MTAMGNVSSELQAWPIAVLLCCSSVASVLAKRRANGIRSMRMWTTASLAAVTLNYLLKSTADPSGVNLAGVLVMSLATTRSGLLFMLDFTAKDRLNPSQLGITAVTWALSILVTVISQAWLTGSLDPRTILLIIGTSFGAFADSLNIATHRLRSQLGMAVFQLAFGIATGAWSLIGKTSIDAAACIWNDPLRQHLAGALQRRIDLRAGCARALSLGALALGGTAIAAASARAEAPEQPLQSRAIFAPHLAKPDLPRVEITLMRPGFQNVMLVLTRSPVSQAADGFAVYIMSETQAAGLYCHIWIPAWPGSRRPWTRSRATWRPKAWALASSAAFRKRSTSSSTPFAW
jgi:hypothetical protein